MAERPTRTRGRRRTWLALLAVFGLLVLLLAGGAAIALRALRPHVPSRAVLVIPIRGAFRETAGGRGLAALLFGETQDLVGLRRALAAAARDDRIRAVLLDLEPGGIGFAQAQEVRALLERFRTSGKPAAAFAEGLDGATYTIACAARPILLDPAGSLDLVGVEAEITLLAPALAKLGIRADLERVGAYKEAYEVLAGEPPDAPSRPVREALDALVDSLYGEIVRAIAGGRERDEAAVRAWIDGGPYRAPQALAAGLVDRTPYRDELDGILEKIAGGKVERVTLRRYLRAGARPPARARVAYIPVVGTIMGGRSRGDLWLGALAGADTIRRALRDAREDEAIRAVILRVASAGGYADASTRIWREVMETRRRKPVVATMGDVAASGGYYVAAGASRIVARPGTLTGSIGIFGGKIVTQGLYEKLGVPRFPFRRGANAGIESDAAPYTEVQRERLRQDLRALYETFVRDVAEGRGRPAGEIEPSARGRVWSGRGAQARGLVDRLGGLEEAIEEAKRLAGIEGSVELVVLPRPRAWYERLLGGEEDGRLVAEGALDPRHGALDPRLAGADPRQAAAILGSAWAAVAPRIAPLARPLALLSGGRPLALLPFGVRLRG